MHENETACRTHFETRFETEAQESSEMAYFKCEIQDGVDKSKNETTHLIPLKLFYYQTFLKLGVINIHDMNIKKMQLKDGVTVLVYTSAGS